MRWSRPRSSRTGSGGGWRRSPSGIDTPDGPLTVAGLSVSVGAAVRPDGCVDLRSLVHAADTALYAAKRAGRNRVRVGSVPVPGTEAVRRTGGGDRPRAAHPYAAPVDLTSSACHAAA